ncbi:hypothetical protein CSHISOI_09484 [Colletotrichum shisoi]|uniref:Uncharacterized protein n=1 Tax=Colletotrichum shisoi TaxID=2078593 RepID=A0A5Q4BGA3_9PEZI|nr:hypothetical protein CSHISOI_09484 [Colletotrichum shisoi]
MRYNQLILSLFLLFTFVIALPIPDPVEALATHVVADKDRNNNGAKKTTAKTANTRTTNNTKRPVSRAADCTTAKKLASGIVDNIDIQKKELTEVAAVKKIVTAKDINKNQFNQARDRLVQTVKDGMTVRERNERMASAAKDTTVMKGLKTVADAQKKELKQVLDLKGTKADVDIINTLETEFKAGMRKNDENRRNVSC